MPLKQVSPEDTLYHEAKRLVVSVQPTAPFSFLGWR